MKLSVKTKLGFASASLADGLCYVLFYSFFLLFLTDYAGVDPAWAGTISLIVVLWDAITDPVMGYISDNWKSQRGRRRPFILYGILPWVLSVVLMFVNISFNEVGKFSYYLFMAMLFWTAYTICLVPYNALGAELTDDYSERASLRLFAQLFSSAGTMLAGVFTLLLVEVFSSVFGVDEKGAWLYVAVLFAILSFVSLIVTWFAMKGHDSVAPETAEKKPFGDIFKEFGILVRDVKPIKWILLSIAFFMCGNSLYGSGIVYAYSYLLGFTADQIAVCGLYGAVIGLGFPLLTNLFIRKFDKKQVLVVFLAVSTAALLAFRFIGMDTAVKCYTYVTLYGLSNFGFWGLFWSFVYDCCEVDMLVNGKARQGTTTSMASMIQKFGSAIAMWLIGIILSVSGYDGMAEVQTDSAMNGILDVITVWPAVLTGCALLFLLIYPINGKKFSRIQECLKEKEATGTYSSEGLEHLL